MSFREVCEIQIHKSFSGRYPGNSPDMLDYVTTHGKALKAYSLYVSPYHCINPTPPLFHFLTRFYLCFDCELGDYCVQLDVFSFFVFFFGFVTLFFP